MYLYELKKFLEQNVKIKHAYVTPCDMLPTDFELPAVFIINLSPAFQPGSHWVALYIDNCGHGVYFDSYGCMPNICEIKHFIKLHCKSVTHNEQQLQQLHTRFCGHYSALFAYYMTQGMQMNDFLSHFGNNLAVNDALIYKMYNNISK